MNQWKFLPSIIYRGEDSPGYVLKSESKMMFVLIMHVFIICPILDWLEYKPFAENDQSTNRYPIICDKKKVSILDELQAEIQHDIFIQKCSPSCYALKSEEKCVENHDCTKRSPIIYNYITTQSLNQSWTGCSRWDPRWYFRSIVWSLMLCS